MPIIVDSTVLLSASFDAQFTEPLIGVVIAEAGPGGPFDIQWKNGETVSAVPSSSLTEVDNAVPPTPVNFNGKLVRVTQPSGQSIGPGLVIATFTLLNSVFGLTAQVALVRISLPIPNVQGGDGYWLLVQTSKLVVVSPLP